VNPERYLEAVRTNRPLVHNITNFVVMNFTANALLAAGASPVMAHAPEEVEEMVGIAGALVLNIGTLDRDWVEAMILAGRRANDLGVPVVIDPVGAGATAYRNSTMDRLLAEVRPAVIRGNASEILSLAGGHGTRGVDATHAVDAAHEAARTLAADRSTVVAVTGPVDFVTDGDRAYSVGNGHHLLSRVTGTGCAATALIAAFLAPGGDRLEATTAALAFFGLAGERAAAVTTGPGSFAAALLDAIDSITPDELHVGAWIEEG
jgi:hydroxyethylthiazole kinase